MTFRLEPLRRKDVGRCAELERILFPGDDPWSESAFRSELNAGHYYVGAYVDGWLVGYAGMALVGRPPSCEATVHTIGVDPLWQRKGVGRALLKALLDKVDELHAPVFLEVRTDNAVAIGLYEANGFSRVGLRRRYYRPSGADAYTMAREPA
ncbi:MAG TPA: ribosomal protein S18-alanine N-acetyltransferase [Actinophytocola sp.]|uniref:ribosomal protein S18-alanine N-acetyltransferase n=1 Tax=Actinophytocola sp. TaxID=1872138 RepID=UPI002DBC0933|nr:ribosomal protein S18-alanine N-acetyltransferase [Actinophytocola sp.]HEU5472170.1 ribosomal protein S18-alanine N-acetyltransferase [Actinophytocola sp.]